MNNHGTKPSPSTPRPEGREGISPAVILYLAAGLAGGVTGAFLALLSGLSWAWVLLAYSCGGVCAVALTAGVASFRHVVIRPRQPEPPGELSPAVARENRARRTLPAAGPEA